MNTICGAQPGPGCLGCYANGNCGTDDRYSESQPRMDDMTDMQDEGFQ
jgi:hypothetical protein